MSPTAALPRSSSPVGIVLVVWLATALLLGGGGLLLRSRVPPPAIALALTAALLLWLRISPSARERVRGLGLRSLVAVHLVRVVAGAYFLLLHRRGVLPAEFALPAGWGDVAVGAGAVLVLWRCLPVDTPARHRALLAWNVVGLVDILGVLANAVRLFLDDPALGEPFTRLPLALLPTFVVPVVIVSHVLLFAWARDPRHRSA